MNMKTVTRTIGERTALSLTAGALALLRQSGRAALVLLLLLVTSATAWAGSQPSCAIDYFGTANGAVLIRGWAFDPDQPNDVIPIHVYIIDASGNSHGYDMRANQVRDDVNSAYGISGQHGFNLSLPVTETGIYTVDVYPIDLTGDGSPRRGHYENVNVPAPYTVTFNANGGSGAPSSQPKCYGNDLTLTTAQPSRAGYHFTEWNTAANGSGTAYSPGAIYTGNANLTLYAQWEQTSISYHAYNPSTNVFESLTATTCAEVTSGTTTMGAADTETWYVVSSNVTISSSRIEVLGTVHLILADGKKLRAEKGLHVAPGMTLNIYDQSGGTGQLQSFATTDGQAGIGGNYDEADGTIAIHGGSIEAIGCNWGAGIGGGRNGNGGTITIYGGTINATGGATGAGIGGGAGANCGTVTIIGGTVIATATTSYDGDNCQAIGSGAGTGISDGTLTIDNIKVYSSAGAANPVTPANRLSTCQSKYAKLMPCTEHNYADDVCTLCGAYAPLAYLAYQTATHSFAELTADNPAVVDASTTTMGAADTETWYAVRNNVTVGSRIEVRGTVHLILCDGKTLTASKGIAVNTGNSLTIYGQSGGTGVLNANATDAGGNHAGIGSNRSNNVGDITIHGGRITSEGAAWSAGIGGGWYGGGGSVTIYGGTINARGHDTGSEAIGHGSSGSSVARTIVEGFRVYVGGTLETYGYFSWSLSQNSYTVTLTPCTEHQTTADHCDYCNIACGNVTYNGNNATSGTVPASSNVYLAGETVTVLDNTGSLVRKGYTFGGWNTQADGLGTDYAPGAAITISGSVTLYAKWTPITYTVRFHKNDDDATGTMSDQAFTYDVAQPLTANAFTRDGYDFMGWSTTTDGAVAYTDGKSVKNLANVQDAVVNLYARWAIPYTITYDLAGGSVATPNPTTYYEHSAAITLKNPTRDGYVFAGWTGTGLAGPTMTVTIPKGSTGNRTYTATWAQIYSITYDLDGGTVATANPTTYTALSTDFTLNNPIRDGYDFAGWTGTDLTEATMTVTIAHGSTGNRAYTATWSVVGIPYRAYNTTTQTFETLTTTNWSRVTSSTTSMGATSTETWYIVDENVTVDKLITVYGTVHLILCDGATMMASKGIYVRKDNSITIYSQSGGTGALTSISCSNSLAGIGGYNGYNGAITIHGGNINAAGGSSSAGIGGGNFSNTSTITIYGGTVNATGGQYAAGIGGGGGQYDGSGGTIIITGGTVTATGGIEAIGHGKNDTDSGTLTLGNMKVYASADATTPVAPADRESTCRSTYAKLMPCTEHNMENYVCTYCGFSICHVSYDGNNATSGTVPTDATDYESGQTVTVLGNTGDLVRTGYNFGGWNTQADGLGTDYAPGATFTITSLVILYAKWEVRQLELANNADNDDNIDTAAGDGMYYDVTLANRTLYTDGDWNTLCLPFDVDDFTGTPLEGATVKTLISSGFEDGTLTMTFSGDLTSIDAGKPYIVKYDADLFIRSTADWNTFADNVTNGTDSYAGKTVKLAADITVTRMAGSYSSGNKFKGTFDGCGHTLTFNYTATAKYCGPFGSIDGATIENLRVAGQINTSYQYAGGIVAVSYGSCTIQNCQSSITISSTFSGYGVHGGLVACPYGSSVNFINCLFDGRLIGSNTKACSGFVGWNASSEGITYTGCLYKPSERTIGTESCCTFNRNGGNTFTNTYYTETFGTAQGTNASGISNETLVSNLGDGWEISGGHVVPKMASDLVNPVFSGVTISSTTANVPTQYVDFVGTYSPAVIYEEGDKHNLYLGSGNTLYYPTTEGYKVNACRAYFQLKNGLTAGDPAAGVRAFVLHFGDGEETAIRSLTPDASPKGEGRNGWYTINGVKLQGKPIVRGIYINNGKKIVVK